MATNRFDIIANGFFREHYTANNEQQLRNAHEQAVRQLLTEHVNEQGLTVALQSLHIIFNSSHRHTTQNNEPISDALQETYDLPVNRRGITTLELSHFLTYLNPNVFPTYRRIRTSRTLDFLERALPRYRSARERYLEHLLPRLSVLRADLQIIAQRNNFLITIDYITIDIFLEWVRNNWRRYRLQHRT